MISDFDLKMTFRLRRNVRGRFIETFLIKSVFKMIKQYFIADIYSIYSGCTYLGYFRSENLIESADQLK